jgi:hypothetical protein
MRHRVAHRVPPRIRLPTSQTSRAHPLQGYRHILHTVDTTYNQMNCSTAHSQLQGRCEPSRTVATCHAPERVLSLSCHAAHTWICCCPVMRLPGSSAAGHAAEPAGSLPKDNTPPSNPASLAVARRLLVGSSAAPSPRRDRSLASKGRHPDICTRTSRGSALRRRRDQRSHLMFAAISFGSVPAGSAARQAAALPGRVSHDKQRHHPIPTHCRFRDSLRTQPSELAAAPHRAAIPFQTWIPRARRPAPLTNRMPVSPAHLRRDNGSVLVRPRSGHRLDS